MYKNLQVNLMGKYKNLLLKKQENIKLNVGVQEEEQVE